MIRKPQHSHGPKAEMNVVPYIDVMLVLLVIFMVTAPLLVQGVKLELPDVAAEALPTDTEQTILTLSVVKEGQYYWNVGPEVNVTARSDQAISLDEMTAKIAAVREQHDKLVFFIRGDKSTDYQAVVRAIAALQKMGITDVSLVTETPDA
ncbi:MAG TPA: ExbD/TolR family protein [Methylophaga aminisulfidivorans]|uniref:Tol-Pal system protein TolR n=2 Tax=root TaxID=1 RepID=A0A7C1W730_9GAMM|nr:ExbD/TolR family protein [Methylophaga aminisulfidivorans]